MLFLTAYVQNKEKNNTNKTSHKQKQDIRIRNTNTVIKL